MFSLFRLIIVQVKRIYLLLSIKMEKDKDVIEIPKRVIALFSSIASKRQRHVTPMPIPRDTHFKIVIIRFLYIINS